MDASGHDFEALAETTAFLVYFKDMPDRRQAGKVVYPLDEILLLCLLAVLAGAEAFTDIARFGEKKLDLLRRFRPFENGTLAHDHLGDIFTTLDAQAFQRCFVAWVSALTKTPAEVVATDGKTSRRSYQKKGAKEPIHIVSAFAARQRLVMGQIAVAEKSNEIVAIPALLDMMAIEGAVVTIDAMGCQRAISKKIKDKKADYIIAHRGNQGTLHEDVKLFAAEQKANGFVDSTVSRQETLDGEARPHRNAALYGVPQDRLVERETRLAGARGRRHGLEPARDQWREHEGNTILHHVADARRRSGRPDDPRSSGDREQPALGHGHGLPRRRMPRANGKRPSQLHHARAYGQ